MLCNPFLFTLESIEDIRIRFISECTENHGHWDFSFFVDFYIDNTLLLDLNFEPASTVWNNLHTEEIRRANIWSEEHTRRTDNLIDDDTLDTIHDKCSHLSHEWNTTEVYILFLDFS